jgi:hypothetical protein
MLATESDMSRDNGRKNDSNDDLTLAMASDLARHGGLPGDPRDLTRQSEENSMRGCFVQRSRGTDLFESISSPPQGAA